MDGAFKILMDVIHKHEGTINQFTGDGVMALFGAPVAHEDHTQRACYTALSVQKAIGEYGKKVKKDTGVDFKMRIGLNSGPVIVGSIGDDLRMDYTAVGDTTNLAARIQQSARPGEVWLSQDTQNIIRGFFQVQSVGDLELKGKAEPQPTYRLVAEHKEVRTRFEAGLAKEVTKLVGRRPEMEILKTAWERARSGEAQVVDVVGEAGVGKSRLAYEFQNTISDEGTILTGICIHYGRNLNFLPLIDIVKGAFGIEEGMSEEDVGKLIEERAVGDLENMIPFYRNLLSLKVDDAKFNALNPEGRKFGTFEAVKNLLLSLSKDRPLVVFLEDVHWIDKISEEFFVFFSHSIHGKRVLMLTAYRPEATPAWAKGPHYRHLGVETLSEKSSGHLVRNILGGLELDPELEKEIVGKTGGNPFFVEEMVRELLAHHWEFSDIPDRAIDYLVLAGEKSNLSQAANAAVDFFTRALNQVDSSDKPPDLNLIRRIRAGRARTLHTMGEIEKSMEDYQEAIRLAGLAGDRQMELMCLVEIPLLIYNTPLKDKVPHFCEQGLELARALGDKGAEARIMVGHALWCATWKGTDECEKIQYALRIAEQSGQPPAIMHARFALAVLERLNGNPQRSLELTEGLVEMLQSAFNIYVASGLSVTRGWAMTEAGRYNEAIQFQSRWINILEQSANYQWLPRCYNGQGWTYSEVYDLEKAYDFNNRSLEGAFTLQKSPANLMARHMQAQAEVNLMENEFEMGKLNEAWEHITRFEKISASPDYDLGRIRWSTRMKDLKGTILLQKKELAQQCLEATMNIGFKKHTGKAERLLGHISTERGAYEIAEAKLRAALAKLEEVGNPKQIWLARTALARLYEKMNRSDLERQQWQAAKAVIKSTADGLDDETLRTTFINAAPVREIMEHDN